MYNYNAYVTKVIDGDTVHAQVDLGFGLNYSLILRLFGINTAELKGKDKTVANKAKLELINLIQNKDVTITTEKDKKEKYGRYLATIFIDGKSVNQNLIDKGLAVAYFGKGKVK